MKAGKNFKRLVHLDEKVITPKDKVGSGLYSSSNNDTLEMSEQTPTSPTRASKTIVGKPKVYDLNGNLLADEENLVVLIGREFLAQLLAGTQGNNGNNYTNYRVTYFGVGNEGTSSPTDCPPTTVGPYDDDVDLGQTQTGITNSRVIIKTPTGVGYDYIDDGKLKRIETDGEITVVEEEHTINTDHGGQIVVERFTAVRYTMYLQPDEPESKPFKFNEAGLFAVRYEYDPVQGIEVPTEDYLLFARFTTLDKYLEAPDGIMIEWYILV